MIYHEHYSYLSLSSVTKVLQAGGLAVFDVERVPTHGGSLRIFAQRETGAHSTTQQVSMLLAEERAAGVTSREFYGHFQAESERIKNDFLRFLLEAQSRGQAVAGYGAAAKGNTLLNYAGVRADLITFVADVNPAKQGKYLPGSHIPVVSVEQVKKQMPEILLIFPWNLAEEIVRQLDYTSAWGARLVTAVPRITAWS
jgi:hypothetical protein